MHIDSETIEKCRVLIANGDTDKAIELLMHQVGREDKSVILISSRWNTLLHNKVEGVISNEDYYLNKSVLDNSILTILDTMETGDIVPGAESQIQVSPGITNHTLWVVGVTLGLIFLGTISIALFRSWQSGKDEFESENTAPMPREEHQQAQVEHGYYVNADSYEKYQDAVSYKNRISQELGYTAGIKEVHINGKRFYRVSLERVVTNETEGKRILDQLRQKNLAATPWLEEF